MDFFDSIRRSDAFRKFAIDDLLFVEYTCEGGGPSVDIWSRSNYFTYVVSGQMTLRGLNQEHTIAEGGCYFVKPGGYTIPTFAEDFCDLILFIPDDFIRDVMARHQFPIISQRGTEQPLDTVMPIRLDDGLRGYYQSLAGYLSTHTKLTPGLIKLKCEEFLVNVLSNRENWRITHYFLEVCRAPKRDLRQIMEENFLCPLSHSEFAALCHRSLSTFRRDFHSIFHCTPGSWLRERRLAHAALLLRSTDLTLKEVLAKSGFRNRSHFMRVFKEKFGTTPARFR